MKSCTIQHKFSRRRITNKMLVWALIVGLLAMLAQPSEGRGLLENVAYNICLYGTDTLNGHLGMVACDKNQGVQNWSPSWNLGTTTSGTITMDQGGRCLTVNGNGLTNGVPVNLYDCWYGAPNQQWKTVNGDTTGKFQLQNVLSGKCLTAENWNAVDITVMYLDQYDCQPLANSPHQFWYINRTGY